MEVAIEAQPPNELLDADCRSLCLRYAQLERKLGEVRGAGEGEAGAGGAVRAHTCACCCRALCSSFAHGCWSASWARCQGGGRG